MRQKQFTIAIVLVLILNIKTYSQYRPQDYPEYEVRAGIGLNKGYNFGLYRYYIKNSNFGLGIGSLFPPKENTHHLALFAENNFQFLLTKRNGVEHSFLINQQIIYWNYSDPDIIKEQAVTLALNFGYRRSSQSDFGFIFDIGPSITYSLGFERKPSSTVTQITKKIQPNFELLLFKRF
jgi:hypothetical protein